MCSFVIIYAQLRTKCIMILFSGGIFFFLPCAKEWKGMLVLNNVILHLIIMVTLISRALHEMKVCGQAKKKWRIHSSTRSKAGKHVCMLCCHIFLTTFNIKHWFTFSIGTCTNTESNWHCMWNRMWLACETTKLLDAWPWESSWMLDKPVTSHIMK